MSEEQALHFLNEHSRRDVLRLALATPIAAATMAVVVVPAEAATGPTAGQPPDVKDAARREAAEKLVAFEVHDAVRSIAGNRGALVLSERAINAVVLDTLKNSVLLALQGVPFPTGHAAVFGRLKSTTLDPLLISATLSVSNPASERARVQVSPGFTITVTLFVGQTPALEFCDIILTIPAFGIDVVGRNNQLTFILDQMLVTASISSSSSQMREAARNAAGLTTDDLLRMEGMFSFGGGAAHLIEIALGELPPIDLAAMFPALDFGGTLTLFSAHNHLAVLPEHMSIVGNSGCPLGDALDGVTVTATPLGNGSQRTLEIKHSGSSPSTQRPQEAFGLAGAYLPVTLVNEKFGKFAPAVSFRDSGGGTFKWSVDLTAALKGIQLSIDSSELGISLRVDVQVFGRAELWVDIPCDGRVTIGDVVVELPNNGNSTVEVLLRPAVDAKAQILMTSQISTLALGHARVAVNLFGRWLTGNWQSQASAFVADTLIGRVLAHNLPAVVSDLVRSQLNQNFFVLAQLGSITKYLAQVPNRAAFSARQDSALVSLTYDG